MDSLLESYLDFDYGLAFIICVVLYGVYFFLMKKRAESRDRSISKKEIRLGLLFCAYVVLVLGGTLLNRSISEDYGAEWVLFWSYKDAYEEICTESTFGMLEQIIYNILMFIPWGILIPEIWRKMRSFHLIMTSALCFSATIEFTQLIFRCGLFEFDDMLHNTLGAVIGWGIWIGYRRTRENMRLKSR